MFLKTGKRQGEGVKISFYCGGLLKDTKCVPIKKEGKKESPDSVASEVRWSFEVALRIHFCYLRTGGS